MVGRILRWLIHNKINAELTIFENQQVKCYHEITFIVKSPPMYLNRQVTENIDD